MNAPVRSSCVALLAAAGLASAGELAPTSLRHQLGTKKVHGYVYANGRTGERVITFDRPQRVDLRGAGGWTWDLSVIDPCSPPGFNEDDEISFVWPDLHDEALGDAQDPRAAGAYSNWFEHPGDTIINGMTFGTFNQVLDPEEDGVEGLDMILVFTESDRAPERSNAAASAALIFEELSGAEDRNNDGIIDFTEGNLWIYFFDFAGAGFDLEVGDTNGVSDGAFGDNSIYSGIPGVDIDSDGLIDSGYCIAYRQPGVAEGDQLIDRFPELAGIGLENPDGFDLSTFPNITPVGIPLAHPSNHATDYLPATDPLANEWPHIPTTDFPGAPRGAWDAFVLTDALGAEFGLFDFGGFACFEPLPAQPPFTQSPWAGYHLLLNTSHQPPSCCKQDLAPPWCVIDLADIIAWINLFQARDPRVDLAPPYGILDLGDIQAFIIAVQSGCTT
jgi:hypothetical protein